MDKEEIESVARKVNGNEMTPEKGASMLMELIYRHRALFGLKSLDEDQIIDFLIYQHPKLLRIFGLYNNAYGTFSSFLQGSVRGTFSTWKKRMIRNSTFGGSITPTDMMQYEENVERYTVAQDNAELQVEAPVPACSAERKNRSLRKKAILILALKSSYYLDDQLISKVSDETGMSKNNLYLLRDSLNATLVNKIGRRNACIRCRDNAYYYHRKYMIESYRLNHQTTWAELIAGKYKKQTKTWIDKNKRLARKEYTVSATNKAVGQALGLDPRHVFYIIKKAKQNVDFISAKQ